MKSFFTRLGLYEIESKFESLFNSITSADEGSYDMSDEEIKATLNNDFNGEVDDLAQNVIAHVNNLNLEIDAYKSEMNRVKERINSRIDVIQNEVKRFDPILAHILKIKDKKSVNYPNGAITSRKTTSVDVGRKGSESYDAIAAILPEAFVTASNVTTYTIDGSAIKKAVKNDDNALPENFHRLVVEKTTYKTK
jgi:hypothetical protein